MIRLAPSILVLLIVAAPASIDSGAQPSSTIAVQLDSLVDDEDKVFLLETLARIDPPERIRELLTFEDRQHRLGGGFHGLLPAPLEGVESLPVPDNESSIIEAALLLARRRRANHEALAEILPSFPFHFRGDPMPANGGKPPAGWSLSLDHSAIAGFLDARSEGEITIDAARRLAALPVNREMLRHRQNLGYVPEPLPTEEELAGMILWAGSTDPLDRLWAWLHPWNFFGYADVVTQEEGYAEFIGKLRRNGRPMTASVLSRLAAHAPEQTKYEGVFALTIGCLIRGWVTPEMPGLNVDQVKDDWRFLDRVVVHETYHKLQPRICPTLSGEAAVDFEDLAQANLGDPRQEKLYEILAYTVLEGTANYAAGPDGNVDSLENAAAGSELLAEFVRQVVNDGELDSAEELLVKGLQNNGPLYAIGYRLSARIAEEEGSRAVGEWLAKGPVAFVLHAEELAGANGQPLLDTEVQDAVKRLRRMLQTEPSR